MHVHCTLYSELRLKYYHNLQNNGRNVHEKPPVTQLPFILSDIDEQLIRLSAKYFYDILTYRRNALYNG